MYDINKMYSESIRDVEIMAADNYSFGHEEMETYDLHPLYLDVEPRQLYAFMHDLDKSEYDLILVDPIPNTGVGMALNDRLKRASIKSLP